jgi:hypothetical protein
MLHDGCAVMEAPYEFHVFGVDFIGFVRWSQLGSLVECMDAV